MEDIKTLFGVIFVLGFIFLLGWGSAKLCDAYYDYRAKRNRTNHPELIELQKEREKVCKEYNQLWDEKYKAEKQIDFIYERMKYYNNNEKLIAKLQKARETKKVYKQIRLLYARVFAILCKKEGCGDGEGRLPYTYGPGRSGLESRHCPSRPFSR